MNGKDIQIALLSLALAFCAGCSEKPAAPAEREAVLHYFLDFSNESAWPEKAGKISFSSQDEISRERLPEPWPLAVRITDFAYDRGKVIAAVNRKGIIDITGLPEIKTTASNDIFSRYTSGFFISENSSLYLHLYLNTFFEYTGQSDHSETETFGIQGQNLHSPFVRIDADEKTWSFADHFFPVKDHFYLTELAKAAHDGKALNWISAWKYSDDEKTLFRYFSHETFNGKNATEISGNDYMVRKAVSGQNELPPELRQFMEVVADRELLNQGLTEIIYRDNRMEYPNRYVIENNPGGADSYRRIYAFSEDRFFCIAFNGRLYTSRDGIVNHLSGVGNLPDSFGYSSVFMNSGIIYAAWEETLFFYTGISGLTVVDEKRVAKIRQ